LAIVSVMQYVKVIYCFIYE